MQRGNRMKNIFSRNFNQRQEAVLNGDQFVVKRLADLQQNEGKKRNEADPEMKRVFGYMVMQFAKVLFGAVGIFAIGTGQDSQNTTRITTGIVFILLAVLIHFYSKRKITQYSYYANYSKEENNFEEKTIRAQLEVPEDAKKIEVMYLYYEPENITSLTFFNEDVDIFCEGDMICFATKKEKLAIPKNKIKGMKQVKNSASLDSWNKTLGFNEGIYEQYQIKSDASIYDQHYITTDFGRGVVIPYYYSIQVDDVFEILLPPYEVDTFTEVTGLNFV